MTCVHFNRLYVLAFLGAKSEAILLTPSGFFSVSGGGGATNGSNDGWSERPVVW
jgi:hypothetical protein